MALSGLFAIAMTNPGFSAETPKSNPMEKAIAGDHYEAMVPDTLDLADRMSLAINVLTNVWIPEEKYSLQFVVDYSRRPPVALTNHRMDAYLNIPPKFIEALAVCRFVSGSDRNIDVDLGVLKAQLSLMASNGLTYAPIDTLEGLNATSMGKEDRPFAEVWSEGRMLIALSMLAQIDKDPIWIETGKRKVDTLLSMMREKDGIHFLWSNRYFQDDPVPDNPDIPAGFHQIYILGALGQGSGLFYRVTGYQPALTLCEHLATWGMKRVFNNADGRYEKIHFHHGLYALMGLCEYGIATGNREVLERVDACYRWKKTLGDSLIGFFPEAVPGTDWYLGRKGNTVEICEVADMVWLALKLTQAGIADYWDDVDRWTRNMYSEGQILSADFLDDIPDGYFNPEPHNYQHASEDRIAERMVGGFWGWMRANEGLDVHQTPQGSKLTSHGIMHCCTANGSRTLYPVWQNTITKDGDMVYVNLLLNRVSKWLDVASFLPVEGKVTLHIKDAAKVALRLPEWCEKKNVTVKINGDQAKTTTIGQYVHIYLLKPQDTVTLKFDLPERIIHRVIGEMPYKLTLRGANVVAIDPQGVAYPLFQNQPEGKLVKKTRFISDVPAMTW